MLFGCRRGRVFLFQRYFEFHFVDMKGVKNNKVEVCGKRRFRPCELLVRYVFYNLAFDSDLYSLLVNVCF